MTVQIRHRVRRHGIATHLAPHVAPGWVDAFVIELRLRGVVGSRIGDALGEVESHCAESGEDAHEAFGDPTGYARSLCLPATTDTSPRALLRPVGSTALGVVGALVLLWGFADPVLRGVVHHPVRAWLAFMVAVAAMAAAFALDGTAIWRIDVGWVVATGATALVSGIAWELSRRQAAPTSDGPVTSPLSTTARRT